MAFGVARIKFFFVNAAGSLAGIMVEILNFYQDKKMRNKDNKIICDWCGVKKKVFHNWFGLKSWHRCCTYRAGVIYDFCSFTCQKDFEKENTAYFDSAIKM